VPRSKIAALVRTIRIEVGETAASLATYLSDELGHPVRPEQVSRWESEMDATVPSGEVLLAILRLNREVRRVLDAELPRWRSERRPRRAKGGDSEAR
jgi:hypothetical protein